MPHKKGPTVRAPVMLPLKGGRKGWIQKIHWMSSKRSMIQTPQRSILDLVGVLKVIDDLISRRIQAAFTRSDRRNDAYIQVRGQQGCHCPPIPPKTSSQKKWEDIWEDVWEDIWEEWEDTLEDWEDTLDFLLVVLTGWFMYQTEVLCM